MAIVYRNDNLTTIASRMARGEYSAVDLTRSCLARIERVDRSLHSFVTVMAERALSDARQADAERAVGRVRGPLHGIPFGVKDVYDVAGVATTAGSPAFTDNIAIRDATAVARLRTAGAVLLGKLATHELTHGGVDLGLPWPPARNPWSLEHDPGGSSSGAGVAVAAGLCAFALGTDTGGSIRKPAGLCGIAGLKPTFGRISRYGVILNAASLDHCGPMARSAADCAIVLQAIAGQDALDPASASQPVPDYPAALGGDVRGTRIGVIANWLDELSVPKPVCDGLAEAIAVLEKLGATVSEVALKSVAEHTAAKLTIQQSELFAAHGPEVRRRRQQFGPNIRNKLDPYESISPEDHRAAKQRQAELTADMLQAMANVDVLITAGPGPAPLLADAAVRARGKAGPDLTLAFNLTGFPAIGTCIGYTDGSLPYSMQVVGRPFDEMGVLRVADAYERAAGWYLRDPAIAAHADETASI